MKSVFLSVAIVVCATSATAQFGSGAGWVRTQQMEAACNTTTGITVDEAALQEPDLNGDGAPDYVFSHEWVTCPTGQSTFCGIVCTVQIYLRENGALVLKEEFLGRGVTVGDGPRPEVTTCNSRGQCNSFQVE